MPFLKLANVRTTLLWLGMLCQLLHNRLLHSLYIMELTLNACRSWVQRFKCSSPQHPSTFSPVTIACSQTLQTLGYTTT